MQAIQFNKAGYEPFLDYVKAYAIICVLIGHTFPFLSTIGYGLWAGLQVPLFVLVQSFHSLKSPNFKLNKVKLFRRILVPYCVVQVVIFLLFGIRNGFNNSLIVKFIYGGVRTRFILSLDIPTDCNCLEICPSYV